MNYINLNRKIFLVGATFVFLLIGTLTGMFEVVGVSFYVQAQGIEPCEQQVIEHHIQNNIHIFKVDMKNPCLSFETVMPVNVDGIEVDNGNTTDRELVRDMVTRYETHNPVLAFNADYFGDKNGQPDHGAEGLIVKNGTRLPNAGSVNEDEYFRSSLSISMLNALRMGNHTACNVIPTEGDPTHECIDWMPDSKEYYNTVAGGPLFIENGTRIGGHGSQIPCDQENFPKNLQEIYCQQSNRWTAAGVTQDGRYLIIAASNSIKTMDQIADVLIANGVWRAMKFDGGGSTQLWYDGKQTIPSSRPIANALLGFFAPMVYAAEDPVSVADENGIIHQVPFLSVGRITDRTTNDSGQLLVYIDWGDRDLTDGWVAREQLKEVPPLFPDVSVLNRFFYYIHLLRLAKITQGFSDGTYRPDDPVLRQEMASFIVRALLKTENFPYQNDNFDQGAQECMDDNPTDPFPDVFASNTHYKNIMCLKGLGIVQGFSDGTYRPKESVKRKQMASFIVRALLLIDDFPYHNDDFDKGAQDCMTANPTDPFPDVPVPDVPDSNPHFKDIMCLKGLGIIQGFSDGTYRPEDPVTREQMAKFIARENSLLSYAEVYPTYDEAFNKLGDIQEAIAQIGEDIDGDLDITATNGNAFQIGQFQALLATQAQMSEVYWVASKKGVMYYEAGSDTTVTYTVEDGLPHNNINTVSRNSVTGDVWGGTNVGAAKFDGSNWQVYTKADGLIDNHIISIANSSSGLAWFATNGGLSQFDGTSWTSYTKKDGLPHNKLNAIDIDADENLWAVTVNGIFGYFDGTNWQTINGLPSGNFDAISIIDDTIYLGSNQGLVKYANDVFSGIEPEVNINVLAADTDGYLWVVSESGALGIYKDDDWLIPISYLTTDDIETSSSDFEVTVTGPFANIGVQNESMGQQNLNKSGLPLDKQVVRNWDIELVDMNGLPITISNGIEIELTLAHPVNLQTVEVYYFNPENDTWEKLPIIHQTNKSVTVQVNHLSQYAVLGEVTGTYLPIILK